MSTQNKKLLLFDSYFRRQHVETVKREADELCVTLHHLLDEVLQEQKGRLRVIRNHGPWHVEWEVAVRQQTERARQMLAQLRRYRSMRQRIEEMERQLPPATGWNRLRYANPWVTTWVLCAISLLINGVRLATG